MGLLLISWWVCWPCPSPPALALPRYQRRVAILEAQKKGTFDGE